MGGTSHDDSHFVLLDLCRTCHDRAHAKRTIFQLAGDQVIWHDTDTDGRGSRSLVLSPDETDEALAHAWEEAQSLGVKAIIKQAEIASAFRKKYGGFDGWWVRVADIIRQVTGLQVSVGLVYDRAALGIAIAAYDGDPEDFVHELGVKSTAQIGRAIEKGADATEVVDFAFKRREQQSKTTVAQDIRGHYLGRAKEEGEPCQTHTCKGCGATWPPAPSAAES